MKNRSLLALIALLAPLFLGAQTLVTFHTNMGTFVVEMREDVAPITAGNFIDLSQQGFYDGVIFHRIISNFVIQGGDPTGTGEGGSGTIIEDEFGEGLSNTQRTLSMANSGPNTGESQFFINLVNNTFLDHDQAPLDSAHPVFGKVVANWNFADMIGTVATDADDRPLEEVRMDSVRVRPAAGDQGWIAHWALDGNALDNSGNYLNGIVEGAFAGEDRTGAENGALLFINNSKIEFGDRYDELLVAENRQFSISAWVLPFGLPFTPGTVSPIIAKHAQSFCQENQEQFYWGFLPGGELEFRVAGSADGSSYLSYKTESGFASSITEWSHLALTYDASLNDQGGWDRANLFLNGTAVPLTTELVGELFNSCEDVDAPLAIGGLGSSADQFCLGSTFQGNLDDIYLFDRILSETDIEELGFTGEPSGINTASVLSAAYPNPLTSDLLQLDIPFAGKTAIVLKNAEGKIVQEIDTENSLEISFADFVSGIYFLELRNESHFESHRIIFNK